jgi:hypothetical protein
MATVPETDESEVGGVGIFTTCPSPAEILTVPYQVPSVTSLLAFTDGETRDPPHMSRPRRATGETLEPGPDLVESYT